MLAGIRSESVDAWLVRHVHGVVPPCRYEQITGGHSNLTYRVTDASGRTLVLRRPPLGSILATAHDMAREFRIISGVHRTDVPVPVPLGLCEDTTVNDAPFYVMSHVDGLVLHNVALADEHLPEPQVRHRLGLRVAETLADLHRADPDTIGLGDLGRRENYVERQLARWKRQWDASKQREIPAMDAAWERLVADLPPQHHHGIVHGDYRLGNLMVTPDGKVAAVLDWELCTLGDPLADVGYLLNAWAEVGEHGLEGAGPAATTGGGFPTRREMLERYAQRSGIEPSDIGYYRAFQYWRLGAILEGVYARYRQGAMAEPPGGIDDIADRVSVLADHALEAL